MNERGAALRGLGNLGKHVETSTYLARILVGASRRGAKRIDDQEAATRHEVAPPSELFSLQGDGGHDAMCGKVQAHHGDL
jgi:hypothetical protein